MITEKDLQEAIAECQGQRNPNANTAIKLAAFLTIQKEMFGQGQLPSYSYASSPEIKPETIIGTHGGSDFLKAISGEKADAVWEIMDELMDTLKVLMPKLYNGVLRQIDFL